MIRVILFLVVALAILAVIPKPKKDYSHVPKEYMHLVKFAESAGL